MVSMKLVGTALVAAGWLAARPALGNGAFPDSQAVITPADRPHEILLATNFGQPALGAPSLGSLVPEPMALGLLAFGGIGLLRRPRLQRG